ncbi:MAG: carboxypeptidase-like regulatory domain-containing protein, partial [Bacteroidota bacterium]
MGGEKTVNFKLLVLFSCVIVLSAGARGGVTGILEGRVQEKDTKQPLVGANVLIVGTELGAATDLEGYFQIPNLRAGTHKVRVTMVGYKTLMLERVLIYPDLRTKLSIDLESTAIEFEEVVVQVEMPLIRKDVTATAYSITDTKIEKLPVTTFQEVVNLQAGVTKDGHVRGGRSTEVVYLVDGLPIQDVFGGGLGSDVPKTSIVHMTIQTGGFDAEYGNAQSGVVNVVTKSGDNSHRFALRGDYDHVIPGEETNRTAEFEASLSGPILRDRMHYFLAQDIFLTDTRWWQDFRLYFDSPFERDYSGFAKVDYHANSSMRLTTQVLYSLRRWHDYEFSWRFNLDGLPARSRDSYRVAAFWTHTLSARSFYTLSVSRYVLKSKVGEGEKTTIDPTPFEYDFFLKYVVNGKRAWWAESRQTVSTLKADWTSILSRSHLMKAGGEI